MNTKKLVLFAMLSIGVGIGCGDEKESGGNDMGPDQTFVPDMDQMDEGTPDMAQPDMPDSGEPDMSLPCDGACEGETGICNELTDTCVQCLGTEDCNSGVCDTQTNTCVPCLGDNDCANSLCILGATSDLNTCKECRDEAQCTEPSASSCGANNECQPCSSNNDCGHIQDLPICVAGTCRACSPDTQAVDCGGKVCDPTNFTCTTIDLGSTFALSECQYDAQCQSGHACVPLQYDGSAHGAYCMPLFTGTACGRPYGRGDVTRTSIDGDAVSVCMIKEELTTPEAIADYETPCTEATAATDCPADGARCEVFDIGSASQSRVCTYTCSGPNDCKPGAACIGSIGSEYCGAPQ